MILTYKTRKALLIITAAAILILSLIPQAPNPASRIPYGDKLEHIAAYILLAFLLALNIALKVNSRLYTALLSAAICILYGAVIEFLQQYTGRSTELLDLIADLVGAGVGATLAVQVKK
ncbi:MAG: hypothetical protein DRP57_02065 [Spirochaetes bacterium]|nr:MAG: hypothetical protein DRP57_02065 [Spirochaetota bacterium]